MVVVWADRRVLEAEQGQERLLAVEDDREGSVSKMPSWACLVVESPGLEAAEAAREREALPLEVP